jgi:hypothetical protein
MAFSMESDEYDLQQLRLLLTNANNTNLPSDNVALSELQQFLYQNVHYQQFLINAIDRINQFLLENNKKLYYYNQLYEKQSSYITEDRHNFKSNQSSFSASFFIDEVGSVPSLPLNSNSTFAQFNHRAWSSEENNGLEWGIKKTMQKYLAQQIIDNFNENSADEDEWNSVQHLIKDIKQEQLLDIGDGSMIRWQEISDLYCPSRSALDCEIQWRNNLDPRINLDKFSSEEEKQLIELISSTYEWSWTEIAQRLNTNRTAMQCFLHYRRHLSNPNSIKWGQQEDEKLIELVQTLGENNWIAVADELNAFNQSLNEAQPSNRTGEGCYNRYIKYLSPNIRSGKWSYEENLRFIGTLKAYENSAHNGHSNIVNAPAQISSYNFNLMSRHIPGRTDVKIREKFSAFASWINNKTNPNRYNFSAAEDTQLIAVVKDVLAQELHEKKGRLNEIGSWLDSAAHRIWMKIGQIFKQRLIESAAFVKKRSNNQLKTRMLALLEMQPQLVKQYNDMIHGENTAQTNERKDCPINTSIIPAAKRARTELAKIAQEV